MTSCQDESTKIWRYTDLAKFITMLSRGVHFSRPRALGDEWEGAWGVENIREFREEFFGRPTEGAAEWEARVAEKRQRLDAVGVSCWHLSDHESAALWALYMPQGLGVAIQSTIGHMTSAATSYGRDLEVMEVEYIDFEKALLPTDETVLLGLKRREFCHENELRFLLRFTEDEQKTISQLEKIFGDHQRWISLSVAGAGGGLVRPLGGIGVLDRTAFDRATPVGIHLPVPAVDVIEKVVLAPEVSQPVRYAVRDVAEAYGLDVKIVCESSQDSIAPDRVDFFP